MRERTIKRIVQWALAPSTECFYLLSGPKACGKLTIAHSIVQVFQKQNRLGASIFLDAKIADTDSHKISSTIIQQLSGFDRILGARIIEKLNTDRSLIDTDVDRQFCALVIDTTGSSHTSQPSLIGPIMIVIDHLHLVGKAEQSKFLATIGSCSLDLPPNFRFFLTYSHHDSISQRILGKLSHTHIIGYVDGNSNICVGIGEYISECLAEIFSKKAGLAEHYGIAELQNQFKRRAMGIQLWVATAYRSLTAYDNNTVLLFCNILLSNPLPHSGVESIGQLYDSLCQVAFCLDWCQNSFEIVNTTIQSPEDTIFYIGWLIPSMKGKALNSFAAKLGLTVKTHQNKKNIIHPSFGDFITNFRRCHVSQNTIKLRRKTLDACIDVMNQHLRYNIIRLDAAMLTNVEIVDKDTRVQRYISKSVHYACHSWISLLEGIDDAKLVPHPCRLYVDAHFTLDRGYEHFRPF